MLNELRRAERGMRRAGFDLRTRHPDVKITRRVPTLRVILAPDGHIESVRPVPADVTLWTLRDGQQNAFPFVQPKDALLEVDRENPSVAIVRDKKSAGRRQALVDLIEHSQRSGTVRWVGSGLLKRLSERRTELSSLDGQPGSVVLATIDRFVRGCETSQGGNASARLDEIIGHLRQELEENSGPEWVDVVVAILLDGEGAFLFDADLGDGSSMLEPSVGDAASDALKLARQADRVTGICGLTGSPSQLVEDGGFPQPKLPRIGQTFLFARNKDTRSTGRYHRFGAATMAVGQEAIDMLSAAVSMLTAPERENHTWRSIPGEVPKQDDLLVSFVDRSLDAPVAALLGDDEERETSEENDEESGPGLNRNGEETIAGSKSISIFERRTEQVVALTRGTIDGELADPAFLHVAVIRSLDPANRKVTHMRSLTVQSLRAAARRWVEGERNTPPWLRMSVFHKNTKQAQPMSPPHVSPLGLIAFSRKMFRRGGTEQTDVTGAPASRVLSLFLEPVTSGDRDASLRVAQFLRSVLHRRGILLSATAHAFRKGFDAGKSYERREALRTVTVLGVLLHKSGRTGGAYMNEAAFKLGQLLAVADVVHAGYCSDVRGGDVPPSLLGNQVFVMAQKNPVKALEVLCQRWKPYEGWVRKAAFTPKRADAFLTSNDKEERQRGWNIKNAIRDARAMRPLASELHSMLTDQADDVFRAELLLGYVAGLPKMERAVDRSDDHSPTTTQED